MRAGAVWVSTCPCLHVAHTATRRSRLCRVPAHSPVAPWHRDVVAVWRPVRRRQDIAWRYRAEFVSASRHRGPSRPAAAQWRARRSAPFWASEDEVGIRARGPQLCAPPADPLAQKEAAHLAARHLNAMLVGGGRQRIERPFGLAAWVRCGQLAAQFVGWLAERRQLHQGEDPSWVSRGMRPAPGGIPSPSSPR